MNEHLNVTQQHIDEEIARVDYFTAEDGLNGNEMRMRTSPREASAHKPPFPGSRRIMFCLLTLRNGFSVVGTAFASSADTFNESRGMLAALADAKRQVWPLVMHRRFDRPRAEA